MTPSLPWYATYLLPFVVGGLLGSIPFGLLLTRAAGIGDIRGIGSGNIGATNVLRTGNKQLAAATLLLDALKGTAAVLIARAFGDDPRLHLSVLAELQGRQGGGPLSRRTRRTELAGGTRLRRRVARRRLPHPLLL